MPLLRVARRVAAGLTALALFTFALSAVGNAAGAAAGGTLVFTPLTTGSQPLVVTPGADGAAQVTVTNPDTRKSTSALTMALSSSDAAFKSDGGCNAVALGPGK